MADDSGVAEALIRSNTPSPKTSPETPATAHSPDTQDASDDVWLADSGDDRGHRSEDDSGNRPPIMSDIHRLRSTHATAGYREGLAAARAAAVQPGFDEGYLLGAAIGIRAGWLRGIMEGLVKAIDFSTASPDLEPIVREHAARASKELRIEELFSAKWINDDGTWKWTVDENTDCEATIHTVASCHPVIRSWSTLISTYCQELGIASPEFAAP